VETDVQRRARQAGTTNRFTLPPIAVSNEKCHITCTPTGVCITHRHTHPFNGPFSGTTQVSQYQKGDLDFTEARDSEWQRHQLGHMQVCISLQTDNHASTPPLSFLQAGCPSCRPTNSVKALKAYVSHIHTKHLYIFNIKKL